MNIEKPNFKKICFMHMQQLTNFPYIEKDFDALTDYELLCKVVDYLNKVIANENEQNSTILALYNGFNELKNYVENYFENLDVQDEINNKLDEMVEDGVLEQIIEQYITSSAIWGFDTVADMKNATNLIDGSYARTLGYYSKNDGGSALYKIRTITNDDVVDETFIIEIGDQQNELIAEYINENSHYNVLKLGVKRNDNNPINTKLLSIISKLSYGNTLYFPEGIYTLNPITIDNRINFIGDEISITDTDRTYGTVFSFTNVLANDICFKLPATKTLIQNIMFYSNSYELSEDRTLCAKGVDVFTETINTANVTGLGFTNVPYGTTIKNCRFRGFSGKGIDGKTFTLIDNCSFWECNDGVNVVSDATVSNCRFFHINRGIVSGGSNNIITNIRMDSIKNYGIYLSGGKANIVNNVNVDYCQYNAILLNNNQFTKIDNIEARCGTIYPYDSSSDGNKTSWSPSSDYSRYLGIVGLSGYANSFNEIHINGLQKNPRDSESTLLCSMFGVTSINSPTHNDIICGNGNYYISDTFYISYLSRAVYICAGNMSGNIKYEGHQFFIPSAITAYDSSNFSKIFMSSYVNPTQ